MANATNSWSFKVSDIEKFEGNLNTNIIASTKMEEKVNHFFKSLLGADYEGCRLSVNDGRNPIVFNELQQGAIYVTLFFADRIPYTCDTSGDWEAWKRSEDIYETKCIVSVEEAKKRSIMAELMAKLSAKRNEAFACISHILLFF